MNIHRGLFADWYGSINSKFYKIIVVTKRETMSLLSTTAYIYSSVYYLHRYNFVEIFRVHITEITALCQEQSRF